MMDNTFKYMSDRNPILFAFPDESVINLDHREIVRDMSGRV